MTLSLHLTRDWTAEQIAPHGKAITACLKKYAAHFEADTSFEFVTQEIVDGAKDLWLIMDGDEVRAVLLTETVWNAARAFKIVRLVGMGGEDGVLAAPLIREIEDWARDNGASRVECVGRMGWSRAMKQHGYSTDYVVVRKEL